MKITTKIAMRICEIAHNKKEGHIGSSLSILNLLNVVYKLKQNGRNLDFILSKGHASLGLYCVLNHYGYITDDELNSFCDYNSKLGGHPDFRKVKGIKFSTGSLGHGLPQALGLAMAKRSKVQTGNVVVLCGDGEMNEGSNWEAGLLAAHHNVSNIKLIVDYNKSSERAVSVSRIPEAFSALGWEVSYVNGHAESEIGAALELDVDRPHLIWAETVKGFGISFMEGNPEWHHKSPNEDELMSIKKELGYA